MRKKKDKLVYDEENHLNDSNDQYSPLMGLKRLKIYEKYFLFATEVSVGIKMIFFLCA